MGLCFTGRKKRKSKESEMGGFLTKQMLSAVVGNGLGGMFACLPLGGISFVVVL